MKYIILLINVVSCISVTINSHQQQYNLFTMTNVSMKNYTYNDIQKYKLDVNHHVNMYTLFTKSYFEKCHNYNDGFCIYTIEDQEFACKNYLKERSNDIVKLNLYYYGIYNNQLYDFIIKPDGSTIKLNVNDTFYETKGMYIIEDTLDNKLEYKIHIYDTEPLDFHYKMMIYYLTNKNNKTIFCPLWMIKL